MSRILLVDDQLWYVESLKTVLESQARDLTVVGIAHGGKEALELLESAAPDLVLMDVRTPRVDGVHAAAALLERRPDVKVVMLTTVADDQYVYDAFSNGAVGYLLKDIQAEELVKSIRAALAGSVLISLQIAKKLLGSGHSAARTAGAGRRPEWVAQLTLREREVLKLLGHGWSNRIIAQRLFVAEQTIKNRVSVIYEKIGVADRTALLELIEREDIDPQKIV